MNVWQRPQMIGNADRSHRGGYALLLMMLITVAIGLLIYYFSFTRPTNKVRAMQNAHPDEFPWVEDWRLRNSGEPRPADVEVFDPSPQQPAFVKDMWLRVTPRDNDAQRGKIELIIAPDGTITGAWSGNYKADNGYKYEVSTAKVEGNTDATKRYRDDSGEDPGQLFFITTGSFVMIETDPRNRVKSVAGDIYIVGWIAPDFTARGKLHLTTDRTESQKVYDWEGKVIPASEMRF